MRKNVAINGRTERNWIIGKKTWSWDLNVTSDSFRTDGKWNTVDKALAHMEEMVMMEPIL